MIQLPQVFDRADGNGSGATWSSADFENLTTFGNDQLPRSARAFLLSLASTVRVVPAGVPTPLRQPVP